MKKYLFFIISIFLLSGLLMGCLTNENNENSINDKVGEETDESVDVTDSETDNETSKVFEARIIESDGGLLVTPVPGSSELLSADKIYVYLDSSEEGEDDREALDFEVGDLVRITYDGLIAESYPAQITASKIELVDP